MRVCVRERRGDEIRLHVNLGTEKKDKVIARLHLH